MKASALRHFDILAVDDDPTILDLYEKILVPEGFEKGRQTGPGGGLIQHGAYRLTVCRQGDEALDIVRRGMGVNKRFSVIFVDLNMPPGPDGAWVADEIYKLDPHTNIVLVSGYYYTELGDMERDRVFPRQLLYLQKPFHRQEIIQLASTLSSKWLAENQLRSLHDKLEDLVEKRTKTLWKSYEKLRKEIKRRRRVEHELQQSLVDLKTVMDATIQAISITVEKRDPYTSGHQRRVSDLARAIANELGIPRHQTEGLYMAAAIHDIGKISLPAEILSKPIQLTDIELSMVHSHAQAGYDILKGIDFPWPIAEIVLQHHERLDGSGYPQGLTGGEILLEARIIGVADVIETMSSHRPYRPSIGLEKAMEEISNHRGRLYDPQVVDACLTLLTRKGYRLG